MARWRAQHSPDVLLPALRQWFRSPVGSTVLKEEQQLINRALSGPSAARRHLLKLSMIPERFQLDDRLCQRQLHLGSASQSGHSQVLDAVCDYHQLPLANESVDMVVLHHVLEFVENPHTVLREVERMIVPHGKLVICGINPWSPLALRGVMGRLRRSPMWQHHSLSINRINDWLSLLGFEVADVQYGFHRLPLNSPGFFTTHRSLSSGLPMGGVFVLSATKYRAPLTPALDARMRAKILRHPAMLGATRNIRQ